MHFISLEYGSENGNNFTYLCGTLRHSGVKIGRGSEQLVFKGEIQLRKIVLQMLAVDKPKDACFRPVC